MLGEEAHARPERGVGLSAAAVGESEQRARVLCAHAKLDRLAAAHPDPRQCLAGDPGPAELERQPRAEDLGVERGAGPPRLGECGGGAPGGAKTRGRGRAVEQRGAKCRIARERRPVRPRLAREAAERRRRLRLRRLAVAVEQRRLGEHQPGLGGLGRHPAGGELGNRPLGRAACLGDQPHREEQLAAVAEAVRHRDAVAAPPVLRRGRTSRARPARRRGGRRPSRGCARRRASAMSSSSVE